MPLAFESQSHGTIAFGFFNIESDMLLLDQNFFFATDFCEVICDMLAVQDGVVSEFPLSAWLIEDSAGIGDLHGGISGTHYSGFIGETYKKYPFPEEAFKFKQQTRGFKTRDDFVKIILAFGTPIELILHQNHEMEWVTVGSYVFSQASFSQLLNYVIRGGYPGWLDDTAPDYVLKMQEAIALNRSSTHY